MAGTSVLIDIVGRDNASSTFMRVAGAAERSGSRMSKSFGGAIATIGKLGAAIGVFEAIHAAIDITKEAAAFQKQMTLIQTQAGASASEIKVFSAALLAMSGKVAQAPEDLATSLYHVYSVGLRGAKALNVVKIAAEGARIGNADLEETTNALTSSVASGIKGVQNMSQAMGALNAIVGAGDMKLSDLNAALSSGLLTVAKSFGVSLKQVGAALATFGDNNIRGAYAATQLRLSILALAAPIQGGQAALDAIGVTAGELAKDLRKGGLTSALDDLHDKLVQAHDTGAKMGLVLTQAFGRKAGVGITILENQINRFHLKLSQIATGMHDFDSDWKTTQGTASFVFAKLGDMAKSAGISLAMHLLPPVTQFAAKLAVDLPRAIGVAAGILKPFASDVGGVLTSAWHTFGTVLSGVGTVLRPVVSLISALSTPLGALATAATGAWIAFKLGSAIPGIIDTISLRLMYAKDAVVGFGTSAKTMATTFVGSTTEVEGAAAATATSVAASGEAATIGWAGILGPLAAVGVGVALLISAFHKSSGASKEAAAAAKAYTDALSSDSGKSSVLSTIQDQLVKNKVPEEISSLNSGLAYMTKIAPNAATALTGVTGPQVLGAITSGGKKLSDLRAHLRDIISTYTGTVITGPAKNASRLLADLNAQYLGLSKATRDDLANTKAFAGVSSSIDKVSQSTKVASDTAKTYAEMQGIVVDKNGVAQVSATRLHDAVTLVSNAYKQATGTGQAFLAALQTFSQSAGTTADRAALIGSTLVAANGDALNFAAQMNASAGAAHDFSSSIKQAASQIGKNGESTKKFLANIVNLKTGTIDYNKAGAAPLISGLQSIQSAAMNAAEAVFQHNKATEGGKRAAADAYNTYRAQTRPQLVDELTSLGMNTTQAKSLARTYLGMPKQVKTLIKQVGGDPVVTVLNKIGKQLAYLTGHPWKPTVTVDDNPALTGLRGVQTFLQGLVNRDWNVHVGVTGPGAGNISYTGHNPAGGISGGHVATGGYITGPGSGTSDSIPAWLSNGEFVVNARQTSRHLELLHAINSGGHGFAQGGHVDKNHALFTGEGPKWYHRAFEYMRKYAKPNHSGAWQYQTTLTPHMARQFERWVINKRVPFQTDAKIVDYDMRGFYKKTRGRGWQHGSHFPDTWKTPYDTTFSDESRYANGRNRLTWHGQRLINEATGQLVFGPPIRHRGNYSFAGGGSVAGPGTGRSDSVLARLSNGEFVVRADQARRHSELLHAINTPGFAAGGPITTKTVNGSKVWEYGGQEYASRMAADNARARGGKTDQASLSSAVSSIIGSIGAAAGSKFSVKDVGINRIWSQIDKAWSVLESKIQDGLSKNAAKKYEQELNHYTHVAQKQLGNLKVRFNSRDLNAIQNALGKTPSDIRTAFKQLFTDIEHAGGTTAKISNALHSAESAMIATRKAITADQNRLATARQFRSGITSTLSGQYDITQSGSISDLITGLHGATGTNRAYTSELTLLRRRYRGSKAGLSLINHLAASGQTATLESLAHGSRAADLRAAQAYGGYQGSLTAGGNAAVMAHFGKSLDTYTKELRDDRGELKRQNQALATLVHTMAKVAMRPAIGGDKAVTEQINRELTVALDRLESEIRHGRS